MFYHEAVDRTISFFSAEASRPGLADLAGLLCCHGQITGFGRTAARLSVVVEEPWRAHVLAREFRCRGSDAQVTAAECGRPQVRTSFRVDLLPLALRWLGEGCAGDAGKAVPDGFRLSGAMLRMWALAGGQQGPQGYLLGVDPLVPDMHERLVEALTPLGVPAKLLGPKADRPAVKVSGRRRLEALLELIGEPPPGAEPAWPIPPPLTEDVAEAPTRAPSRRTESQAEALDLAVGQ